MSLPPTLIPHALVEISHFRTILRPQPQHHIYLNNSCLGQLSFILRVLHSTSLLNAYSFQRIVGPIRSITAASALYIHLSSIPSYTHTSLPSFTLTLLKGCSYLFSSTAAHNKLLNTLTLTLLDRCSYLISSVTARTHLSQPPLIRLTTQGSLIPHLPGLLLSSCIILYNTDFYRTGPFLRHRNWHWASVCYLGTPTSPLIQKFCPTLV